MPMPEATVNEHRHTISREQEVWLAREVFSMEAKAKPGTMYGTPDSHLA